MNNQVIEDAFIATMGNAGQDAEFLRGFLNKSATIVDGWTQTLKEAMQEDPEIHVKVAEEIIESSPMYKQGLMKDVQKTLQEIGGAFAGDQAKDPNGAGMTGGMIGGGGGGALIGLVLSKILEISPMIGMLLGASLGLGAGGMIGGGSNVSGQNNFTNKIKDMLGARRSNDVEDVGPKELPVEKSRIQMDKTIGTPDNSLPPEVMKDLQPIQPEVGESVKPPAMLEFGPQPTPPGQQSVPKNVGTNPPNPPQGAIKPMKTGDGVIPTATNKYGNPTANAGLPGGNPTMPANNPAKLRNAFGPKGNQQIGAFPLRQQLEGFNVSPLR